MSEFIRMAQKAVRLEEVQEIAKILSKYNLGICIPHMHGEQTGGLVQLPSGTISCERNLTVSFEDVSVLGEQEMEPIAWRWNGTTIEVCASCCTVGE